ncbi:MAG: M1 family metallopeptidase [Acidobacteriota bacterium]|nr:M1 family metallopeptidase [Acidobacteriota bacterium]
MFVNGLLAAVLVLLSVGFGFGQSKLKPSDKFRQLEEILPSPNEYRTASGAPGNKYWQQRADYVIDVELDDVNQRIIGKETVTYKNLSPDTLNYIWLQIDQNIFAKDSDTQKTQTAPSFDKSVLLNQLEQIAARSYDGRVNITSVRDAKGNALKNTIVNTMMRIDLPTPLVPGGTFVFAVDWNYAINNQRIFGGRTGYEYFQRDKNYIYEIAQWFPRMAAYYDVYGWQHKQYLGSGEFTLEFGDYLVRITAPNDHVVASTGVLQNPRDVLTKAQIDRLKQAETAREPIKIITNEEAKANESSQPTGKKTWVFKGDNVRDFAFASSRKFIWDAQGHNVEGSKVTAMSYYPNEGNPLWEKYSTHAIIHTLNVYSRYSFTYPYPIAISVNGPVGGMEYPMICFNGPRPNADGTYSAGTKYGLISVIIHEVGHNYYPMVINSDERQWTWMDEGLNTFVQYLAESEWEKNYPSRRGEPQLITDYMLSENQVPIMTNSDSVLQFGNNAYGKPATALNILRETVMGRDLFDFAFKQYAQRWKFKRPTPADFFRTMEDASGVDLDWFWNGWFYTTDHVDISIENVRLYQVNTQNPQVEKEILRKQENARPKTLSEQRNEALPKRIDQYPSLRDFYNDFDQFKVSELEKQNFQAFVSSLDEREKSVINAGYYFYVVDLKNVGGLVMPLIFKVEYMDGTSEEIRIPAEIWRYDNFNLSKLIVTKKEAKAIVLDPNLETADADLNNNFFPRRVIPTRFQTFKSGQRSALQPVPNQPQTQPSNPNASLTGKWNITIDAGGQSISFSLNLTQIENTVTGTVESQQGMIQISSGSYKDGVLTLKTTSPIELSFVGQVVGNSISGNVTAPQGTTTFSGSKIN